MVYDPAFFMTIATGVLLMVIGTRTRRRPTG